MSESRFGCRVFADRTETDEFTDFVSEVEPSMRRAFTAAFGLDLGREAAAEALAYGWQHWSRVSAMENPSGYLYRVGINHGRRVRKRKQLALPSVSSVDVPWVEPGLPDALSRLSEKERVAVFLVSGHGWSLGEVADLWGVSKGTVQKNMDRGMGKLRRRLGVEQ